MSHHPAINIRSKGQRSRLNGQRELNTSSSQPLVVTKVVAIVMR